MANHLSGMPTTRPCDRRQSQHDLPERDFGTAWTIQAGLRDGVRCLFSVCPFYVHLTGAWWDGFSARIVGISFSNALQPAHDAPNFRVVGIMLRRGSTPVVNRLNSVSLEPHHRGNARIQSLQPLLKKQDSMPLLPRRLLSQFPRPKRQPESNHCQHPQECLEESCCPEPNSLDERPACIRSPEPKQPCGMRRHEDEVQDPLENEKDDADQYCPPCRNCGGSDPLLEDIFHGV